MMNSAPNRTALFIAAFDSQLKWCASLIPDFQRAGFSCSILVPDVRNALSREQIAAVGVDTVEYTAWERMIERCRECDVLVIALIGPLTKRLIFQLHESEPDGGPVKIACWVGIIIEKQIAGYLDRCGADIVSVNSREDYDRFRTVAERLRLPTDNLILNGLPFLPPRAASAKKGPIRTVLFADQPTIPNSWSERRYVYERLIAYARRHPERLVLLKPRHKKGEDTLHKMRYHPEDVLSDADLPKNFQFTYTPISHALDTTDLLITVSSTACLEAVSSGVKAALVLDLGVHERLGNHVFVDSGLLRTFDQLESDDIGVPEPEWLHSYFLGHPQPPSLRIVEQSIALVTSGARPGAVVRKTDYFSSAMKLDSAMLGMRGPENYAELLGSRRGPVLRKVLAAGNQLTPPLFRGAAKGFLRRLGII